MIVGRVTPRHTEVHAPWPQVPFASPRIGSEAACHSPACLMMHAPWILQRLDQTCRHALLPNTDGAFTSAVQAATQCQCCWLREVRLRKHKAGHGWFTCPDTLTRTCIETPLCLERLATVHTLRHSPNLALMLLLHFTIKAMGVHAASHNDAASQCWQLCWH